MSGRAPAVSVLLPVRDAAGTLVETIESLSAQTFHDFEVIAVDDGSRDGSPELLETWAGRDERVRVVRQEGAGLVAALERARALAHAPFLARMDADDVAHPERLSRQHALLAARPELVGCGCLVEYFPPERVRAGARRYQTWINAAVTPDEIARAMFVECPLAHPTFFLRAEAVATVGGYRDVGWPEDYDLILRLWAAGGSFAKVDAVLLRWREAPDRLSRTDPRYTLAAFVACKAHHLSRTLLVGGRPAVVWGAGPVGKSIARALASASVRIEAFVELDPRKIGQKIHGAPVLDPDAGLRARGPLHLAAVGQEGARDRLVEMLSEAGLVELEDFVAVA